METMSINKEIVTRIRIKMTISLGFRKMQYETLNIMFGQNLKKRHNENNEGD